MKKLLFILLIILLFFSSTKKPAVYSDVFTTRQAPLHYSVFQDISVLISSAPDSAFMLVKAISDTLDEAKMTPPDRHEYNILLAETLYKNDYPQLNDTAVNAAALFFDSVAALHPENHDLQYQKARAYYYKGVGDNEKDDIVEACKDYLTALEVMESCFGEKDLDYGKTRFIALIYTRLGFMLYNESLFISSIECFNNSLEIFRSINDTMTGLTVIPFIGNAYYIGNELDSALTYYNYAYKITKSYNNVISRDIRKSIASVYHDIGKKDTAIMIMNQILPLSSEDEKQIYEFTIGEMYYKDKMIDSALFYVKRSFSRDDKYTKMASAKILYEIYNLINEPDSSLYYKDYYTKLTTREIDRDIDKTRTNDAYNYYMQKKHKSERMRLLNNIVRLFIVSTLIAVFVIIIIVVVKKRKDAVETVKKNKRIKELESENEKRQEEILQIRKEIKSSLDEIAALNRQVDQAYMSSDEKDRVILDGEWKIKLLEGRLKSANERIREKDGTIRENEKELLKMQNTLNGRINDVAKLSDFYNQPICQEVVKTISRIRIKTDADVNPDLALTPTQLSQLIILADKYFDRYTERLRILHPELKRPDIIYCCLILFNLDNAKIGALMGCEYQTIIKRTKRLKRIFNTCEDVGEYLKKNL